MCTQTREPFLVHVLMDAQLDSTLVASEHITERMRTNKTEYHVELANSIQVLSPLQQKRVEDVLNEVYGEMKREERIERLRQWDIIKLSIINIHHCNNEFKISRFSSTSSAAKALRAKIPCSMVRISIRRDDHWLGFNSKAEACAIMDDMDISVNDSTVRVYNGLVTIDGNPNDIFSCTDNMRKLVPNNDVHVLTQHEMDLFFGPRVSVSMLEQAMQFEHILVIFGRRQFYRVKRCGEFETVLN